MSGADGEMGAPPMVAGLLDTHSNLTTAVA